MTETQKTIVAWCEETFGPATSSVRIAARANEEMAELIRAVATDDRHPKAAEEIADVFIILYRLAERLGVDLHGEIDRKMAVNRARAWRLDGSGHGYHVRQDKGLAEKIPVDGACDGCGHQSLDYVQTPAGSWVECRDCGRLEDLS